MTSEKNFFIKALLKNGKHDFENLNDDQKFSNTKGDLYISVEDLLMDESGNFEELMCK